MTATKQAPETNVSIISERMTTKAHIFSRGYGNMWQGFLQLIEYVFFFMLVFLKLYIRRDKYLCQFMRYKSNPYQAWRIFD